MYIQLSQPKIFEKNKNILQQLFFHYKKKP